MNKIIIVNLIGLLAVGSVFGMQNNPNQNNQNTQPSIKDVMMVFGRNNPTRLTREEIQEKVERLNKYCEENSRAEQFIQQSQQHQQQHPLTQQIQTVADQLIQSNPLQQVQPSVTNNYNIIGNTFNFNSPYEGPRLIQRRPTPPQQFYTMDAANALTPEDMENKIKKPKKVKQKRQSIVRQICSSSNPINDSESGSSSTEVDRSKPNNKLRKYNNSGVVARKVWKKSVYPKIIANLTGSVTEELNQTTQTSSSTEKVAFDKMKISFLINSEDQNEVNVPDLFNQEK